MTENIAANASHRIPPASKLVTLVGDYGTADFKLHRGGVLQEVVVAYESWGSLSDNHDNVILVFGGLSPSAHAASSPEDPSRGWWEFMIGPGKPIDTDRFYVVCVNSFGSCFGSTNPSSINPETGKAYGLDFPDVSIEDIAKSAHHALQDLGIDHLHAVVGGSMGGMSSLAYALMYPDEVDHLISISAAARALPFTIAVRSLQREIIRCDPGFKNGQYDADEEPTHGMMLARKLGLMSYRASEEWHQRFNRARVSPDRKSDERFGIEFEVESYLDYNAKKFVRTFDANSYLYLSRAMDLFDVAEHGGSVNAGLAKIQAKSSLIIGVETDILFPVQQQEELAEGIQRAGRKAEYIQLNSINGHDSFLVDEAHFGPVVRNFFDQT
ncbi:homoserine O-acetyltransferase [Gammaproteobacteria bacterium]|jgi:homoserine O-acetyltransferase/O-succinyltransferase|nr:homoserine O-acetyltransferase [Pseudomonadota bacterium]MDC1284592.1 homoserine O-acetyltransferase [Gammaproteobacteria bacterium]